MQIAYTREITNSFTILVGLPDGKISVARPRRRWEDNIKTQVGKM
jgi:hypothetical protein